MKAASPSHLYSSHKWPEAQTRAGVVVSRKKNWPKSATGRQNQGPVCAQEAAPSLCTELWGSEATSI